MLITFLSNEKYDQPLAEIKASLTVTLQFGRRKGEKNGTFSIFTGTFCSISRELKA